MKTQNLYLMALCATALVSCSANSDSTSNDSLNADERGAANERDMMGLANSVRFDDDDDVQSLVDSDLAGDAMDAGLIDSDGQADQVDVSADAGLPPTRVDMAVVEMPAICQTLPGPPDAPILQRNVDCQPDDGRPRIQDIQAPNCAGRFDEGDMIELDDAVVTAIFPPKPGRDSEWDFVIQDPAGGSYSGIWIYVNGMSFDRGLAPGDIVRVEGRLKEFHGLTELVVTGDEGGYRQVGQGPLPQPVVVHDPSLIADDGQLAEILQSVLVEVRNLRVTNTAPDCPLDFDMFSVQGALRIEDEVGLDYQPALGDVIERATGILNFSFDHQKIIPRGEDDLVYTGCGGLPSKCEVTECIVSDDEPETGALVITEIQDDPRGLDAEREYIELYNPGGAAIDLSGWWIQNCGTDRSELSGTIRAGEYLVVSRVLDESRAGGVRGDVELRSDVFLGNGQGEVLLFAPGRTLVDQVRYESIAPWPARQAGQSLELIRTDDDNARGAVWRAGRNDYGPGGRGTPGRAND
ncbi:MAG: lamin tail domain-containing protein [Myxococcota bacterium]|nr:lamin tail domain-containing protein [Myxococcota bacterium]